LEVIIKNGPKVLEKKVLWEGRFLRCLQLRYEDRFGRCYDWEAFQRRGVRGIVAIVPFTCDGNLILVRQFRPPVEKYVVEFPAGLNDKGEPLEEVARRELLEETGYLAKEVVFLMEGPLTSGSSTEILTVFLARDVEYHREQTLDEVEDIEVLKIPLDGFYERLFEYADEKTWIDLKIPGFFEIARRRMKP